KQNYLTWGMPEVIDNKTIFSLLEVTRSIQKTLADRYKSLYWVKAEMNKLNHYRHSGHCYPELVEKKNGKIVAEMRSVLWKSDYDRINQQFLKLLDEPLRDGITILFQAGISYDPLHGLSLRIVDIDPTFVLGELEKEKKESIKRLHAEGIFDANKRLPFPTLPKRLAIISVETSKGLSDFYKIIRNNPWHYHFRSDPLHGLSLRIVDIDPTFVLGELEKEKKESIKRLHAEGIFDANKRLPFPTLPKRLAIISVETSKGLSDFYKIIRNNPWHYHF